MIVPIFPLLSADAAVKAVVGTNPVRVYPAGNIPQATSGDPNQNLPCVTWQSIGGHTENIMDERPPVDYQRVQIDCWAMTFSVAQALSDAVRAALELHGNCTSLNGHDYEPDTRRYRASFDFSFWVCR